MVRRGAGFDTDQTWRQLLEESQDIATLQLPANNHLAASVNAVNLTTDLAISKPIVLSSAWLAPLNRGSLNSAHIHGTDVPVEEPSTASNPEVGGLRGEERRRLAVFRSLNSRNGCSKFFMLTADDVGVRVG